jgi:hypothetical protein
MSITKSVTVTFNNIMAQINRPTPPIPPRNPRRPRLQPNGTAKSPTRTNLGNLIRAITLSPEFDSDRYHEDRLIPTRLARRQRGTSTRPPLARRRRFTTTQNHEEFPSRLANLRWEDATRGRPAGEPTAVDAPNPEIGRGDIGGSYFLSSRSSSRSESSDVSCSDSEQEPYHVFSKQRKWFVIVIVALAAVFSGISSNIYFPALDQISSVR